MHRRHDSPPLHSSQEVLRRECDFTADELLRALLRLAPERRLSLLDSGGARAPDARYLIAGFDPFEVVEARADHLSIWRREGNSTHVERGSLLALLDARLAELRVAPILAADLPAVGACVATFAYDFARRFQRLRSVAPTSPLGSPIEPDAVLAFYDTLVIHDYARASTHFVSVGGQRQLESASASLKAARATASRDGDNEFQHAPLQSGVAPQRAVSNFTRAEYCAAVEQVKAHIYAGDIYQANLTQQLTCALATGDTPEGIFLRLRGAHPASFAALLRRGADTVISASPERFLRVSSIDAAGIRRIEAWPIKGTRPRGATVAEDERLRRELETSEKDRAENVMIVDLLRNDLGRVCRYGSIAVDALCELQTHPTLFHLVSRVRGDLRDDVTASELLRAAFPCGSITGAPKLRAMEIIDGLETTPRGLSMGALGYFSFDGALDLNVAIRTMTIGGDWRVCFNVGGGIVAESDPAREYEESLTKARALLQALGAEL